MLFDIKALYRLTVPDPVGVCTCVLATKIVPTSLLGAPIGIKSVGSKYTIPDPDPAALAVNTVSTVFSGAPYSPKFVVPILEILYLWPGIISVAVCTGPGVTI